MPKYKKEEIFKFKNFIIMKNELLKGLSIEKLQERKEFAAAVSPEKTKCSDNEITVEIPV